MEEELNIVYFAWVKERLGKGEELIIVPETVTDISLLIDFLSQKGSAYNSVFKDLSKLRFALDQNFVSIETPIGDAKELAIFPPVTGG